MYSIYLSASDLLSFIITNSDKHEFSSRWKWITCSNDVMNRVDCVIKRDVYPQKKHSCSKNIRGISLFVSKKIRGTYTGYPGRHFFLDALNVLSNNLLEIQSELK